MLIYYYLKQWQIHSGAEGTFAPPPLKSAKKKRCSAFTIFPYLVVKMQNFLGTIRSPVLFNNIIDAYLTLKLRKLYVYIFILPSFYTTATEATGEGKFDVKMQDFRHYNRLIAWALGGGRGFAPPPLLPNQGSALDLTGDLGGPQTSRQISPPLTRACKEMKEINCFRLVKGVLFTKRFSLCSRVRKKLKYIFICRHLWRISYVVNDREEALMV